ncbi:MAG: universal stress protein [Desulfobacterales bacterium]|nr:MAG: universal stress protein [Desulfobacterales bacterium]
MKILVAYDGSNASKEALRLAVDHTKAFQGQIYLVHSMVGGPEVPRKDFEQAERDLAYQRSLVKEQGLRCESLLSVRGLEAGEDLVKLAAENEIDEIIIGIRRRSKVGKILFGSTAQYVILNAPCPVVTVK